MTTAAPAPAATDDDGMGLIEIVVSMFVLAIIAMAFLPLLIQGVKQTASTTTLATGNQIVSEQMELAQSVLPTCSTVTGFGSATLANVVDPRGVELAIKRSAGECPAGVDVAPGVIPVSATVTRVDTGDVISTASTLIFVNAN